MASSQSDAIAAIKESLPPVTDYLTYLTIIDTHLSPEILPALNEILQDAELTQNIGWDLIGLLLPLPRAGECLTTIARLGNPREVVLKVTEALQIQNLEDTERAVDVDEDQQDGETTSINRFCTLVNLLSILHPRIKTKYPSRFLSTSLMGILAAYRPSNQATLAVIMFVHAISGKKRPPLPGRKSSLKIPTIPNTTDSTASAPDPEAQDEDPREAAIQTKLLQSFVTHILEEYIKANSLEWSTRLCESFSPGKVVAGRQSLGEAYRQNPTLQTRDTIVGQLVALLRDLGLSDFGTLFDAIYKIDSASSENESEETNYPTSPGDVPLSRAGTLFLMTSFIFSSILFESKMALPELSIFPDHAMLVKQFIGPDGPTNIGNEEESVVDAILAIGLWLEQNNNFVSGPLEDDDFLQYLQSLSLLSANCPSSKLRYSAHVLTSSILHAHPTDRLRLTFISDTLEHCPYETLKASAVSWLKEEITTGMERKSENVFTSTVALGATRPYLFPNTSAFTEAGDEELLQGLQQTFPFNMAVLNFLIFVRGEHYSDVVPTGMLATVEEIYLGPLRSAHARIVAAVTSESLPSRTDIDGTKMEMELLGDRIELYSKGVGV